MSYVWRRIDILEGVYLLLALALATTANAPRVSLSTTGSVTSLLQKIASQTNVRLESGHRLGSEVLITDVHEAPLDEVMAKIAWATYGEWEKLGSGYRLIRDSEAELQAQKQYVNWQTREAAAAFARLRRQILERNLAPARFDPNRFQMTPARGLPSTGDRALATALADVRPEHTIFAKPNSECVYDTRPTPVEFKLGASGRKALELINRAAAQSINAPIASRMC